MRQHGKSGKTASFLAIADAMVLSQIRAALGLDCAKMTLTSAAPIMYETLETFGSYGLTILEGYGMSECCGVATLSTNERYLWGSVGMAMPGTQVKIFKQEDGKGGAKM